MRPPILTLLLLAPAAWSIVHHVPADQATIAAALALCATDDTVMVAPGSYHEHWLSIQHPLTLMGEDPSQPLVVIDGDGEAILQIRNGGSTCRLEGLTLQHAACGYLSGGAIDLDDTEMLTISNCDFANNIGGAGGALRVGADATALLRDCHFNGGDGSSIVTLANLGDCTLIDCDFWGFSLDGSFDASIINQLGTLPLRLYGCDFHDNGDSQWSSVLTSENNTGPIQLEDCLFIHNVLGYLINQGYYNTLDCLRCRFESNECRTILALEGTLTECQLLNNESVGAVLASNGLQLVDCTLLANTVTVSYSSLIEGSAVALTGCTLVDNHSPDPLLWTRQGTLVRCLLVGNDCPELVRASSSLGEVSCTDSYGNSCADWGGLLEPFAGTQGNMSVNPRLRDLEWHDLRPALGSPARPEGNSCGQLIGALAPVDETPAPMALFSASVAGGAAPLSVDFHALDLDAATSWAWDFDEDQAPDAFGADANWTFTQHGRHDVTLTAGDGDLTRTRTRADVVTAGGALLRVPEDMETLAEALTTALPADTVDLACGDHLFGGWATIPWGVTLRGRAGGARCARIVFQQQFMFMSDLAAGMGPLPCRIMDLELSAHSTSLDKAELQVYQSSLVLENCRLVEDLIINVSEGSLSARDCLIDSLYTVLAGGRLAVVELERCRLDNCVQIAEGYFESIDLDGCELNHCALLMADDGEANSETVHLSNCTLFACDADLIGGEIDSLSLERDLVVNGAGALLSPTAEIGQLSVTQCDIWNQEDGNWTGRLAAHAGQDGNIEADPYFCDPGSGGLGLAGNSPCLIDSSAGVFMGAHGLACQLSQPMAAYTVSRQQGAAPLIVDFRATGLGEISSYQWDLDGDGVDDASGTEASFIYDLPGAYQPRLRMVGPGGQDEFQGALIRAGGRTLRVPEDHPTIAAALGQSAAGDTVVVGCGVWSERGLVLPAGVLLKGAGPLPCATLDGQALGLIMTLEQSAEGNRIEDLAFLNGSNNLFGGAILLEAVENPVAIGPLILRRCRFADNHASFGGAVSVWNNDTPLQADSCEFIDNSADSYGGAIHAIQATMTHCRFQGNRANRGGAVNANAMDVEACELEGNRAEDGGGLAGGYSVTVRDSRFGDNRASHRGGAIYTQFASTTHSSVIENCLFHHNRAVSDGGAIYDVSVAHINNCTFYADSTAQTAGVLALRVYSGTPQVSGCILAASQRGRSLSVGNATPLISCTDMWGNYNQNWPPPLDTQLGLRGNIQADPHFCHTATLDFALREDSPCHPEQSGCGWMGSDTLSCQDTDLSPGDAGPRQFVLHPASPNPFNPSTLLRFELDREGPARLALYNLLGQEVRVLVDERLPAGLHRRMLDGSGLASGVYVLSLRAEGRERQQKILLLK